MLRIRIAVSLTMLCSAASAIAQSAAPAMAQRDAADSATTARTEYRAAREALARGDTSEALRKLRLSAAAWPMQPAYSNALLDLALRAEDWQSAELALGFAKRIGVALPASDSLSVKATKSPQLLRAFVNEQNAWRAPIARGTTFRTLADSSLFPEALGFDPRNRTTYVSSIQHRTIVAIAADGRTYTLLRDNNDGVGGIYGIVVDTARNVLWAASAPTPGANATGNSSAPVAALLEVRLRDGMITRRIPIPAAVTNASPGDIALAPNGDVLVADSQAATLWWLRGTADTLVGIRHHLFRSLQGIVPALDGTVAWVADYSHGLLRVELRTGAVERVADLWGHTTVGMDGMVRRGNALIAVQNGFSPMQVVQIQLNASGTQIVEQSVIDRNTLATSPTGGVLIDDQFVYIANSLWELVDANGKFPPGTPLPRPLLLSVPLKP